MKLRYWYKVDQNKHPIPGSNVRRKSRPGPKSQWKEILDPCCSPLTVPCTCGPRYFVQLDGKGKPVDGSLLKRVSKGMPEGTDGAKFMELLWKSPCCSSITWEFLANTSGSFVVTVNGNTVVNALLSASGKVQANPGDTIVITVTNTGGPFGFNTLNITGGTIFSDTTFPVSTHTFIWNGKDAAIFGEIDPTG